LQQDAGPVRFSSDPRVGRGAVLQTLASARPNPRMALSMLADSLVAGFAAFAALYLHMVDGLFDADSRALLRLIPIFMVIAAVTFGWFGVHRSSWRYASISELWLIIKSATAAVLLVALGNAALDDDAGVPFPVFAILWLLLIVGTGGARLCYRQFQDWRENGTARRQHRRACPVLLFGSGSDAEFFIRAVGSDPKPAYRVVGMIDDSDRLVGRSVHGVPILGSVGNLPAIVRRLEQKDDRPSEIIFTQSTGAMASGTRRELLALAQASGLTVSRLPSLSEIASGVRHGRIEVEPVTLEDLLGRAQHALDHAAIGRLISGRRVLVTGAGGSIGSELSRQIAPLEPACLMLADHSEFSLYNIDLELAEQHPRLARAALICDVRDRRRVHQLFAAHRPDVVFHAAALKHVPLVEENPAEGVLTNVQGTVNVADACLAQNATAMVLISTDKAVKPTGVMGATKRVAEHYCQALDLMPGATEDPQAATRFVTVRFGNILASSGSVVPLFQRQISQGGPVTVTHPEMTRYFMTNREATSLILQASAHALRGRIDRGQIFILDMGEQIRILEVARQLIRLAGLAPEVDIGIELVGLRPGEKLHEELFYPDEVPRPSQVDGILTAARPKTVPLELLRPAIAGLVSAAVRNDVASIHEALTDILQRFDRCHLSGAGQAPEVETSSDYASPAAAAPWPRPDPIIDGVSPEPAWRSAGGLG
jgi:FlaA1/EpsC-like NDP-sugar epimerase